MVRVLEPGAESVAVFWEDDPAQEHELKRIHEAGLFEGSIPYRRPVVPYALRVRFPGGNEVTKHDTYFFSHELSDFDLYLFGQGRHYGLYHKFGAHLRVRDGVKGTHFAVWAPNAEARQRRRQLQLLGRPQARDAGARRLGRLGAVRARTWARASEYKFEIRTQQEPHPAQVGSFRLPHAEAAGDRVDRRLARRLRMERRMPGCANAGSATGAARRSTSTKCTCRAGSTRGTGSRRSTPGRRRRTR